METIQKEVYAERKSFSTTKEFKTSVDRAVENIEKKMLEKLILSISRRMEAVIDAKGEATKY